MKRNDEHRPGALVPGNYEPVLSYDLASSEGGWPIPSFGINCELDRRVLDAEGRVVKNGEHDADGFCCVIGLLHVAKVTFADHGSTGKCTVCGSCFVHGDVWRHVPTNVYIHVGHICSAKYGLMMDRSAFELERGRFMAAMAKHIARERNAAERQAFLDKHPGLEEALKCGHHVVQDIAAKFFEYRSLSEKQVALVMKLDHEAKNPRPVEPKVDAPTGRVTFTGKVVSVKVQEGAWGNSIKMTVKVTTPEGVWLAWGTAPAAVLDQATRHAGALRGKVEQTEVEVTATLKPGRERGFAIMSRPVGKVTKLGCGGAAGGCSTCEEEAAKALGMTVYQAMTVAGGIGAFFRAGAEDPRLVAAA